MESVVVESLFREHPKKWKGLNADALPLGIALKLDVRNTNLTECELHTASTKLNMSRLEKWCSIFAETFCGLSLPTISTMLLSTPLSFQNIHIRPRACPSKTAVENPADEKLESLPDMRLNQRKDAMRAGAKALERAQDKIMIIKGGIAQGLPPHFLLGPYSHTGGISDYHTLLPDMILIKAEVAQQEKLVKKWSSLQGSPVLKKEFLFKCEQELSFGEHRRRFPWKYAPTVPAMKPAGSVRWRASS